MDQILSSWKEIAAYFGKGVRTVQRWEQSLGLPVRRPAGAAQNIVFARTIELQRWLEEARSGAGNSDSIKTILLMEKDEEMRSMRRAFLEHAGFLVFSCQSTDRALDIFKRGPRVDLLMTTVDGAESGGMDLAEEVSLLKPSLPVVAMCEQDQAESLRQRGWHTLPKDSLPEGFTDTIQLLFTQNDGKRQMKVISFPNGSHTESVAQKAEAS